MEERKRKWWEVVAEKIDLSKKKKRYEVELPIKKAKFWVDLQKEKKEYEKVYYERYKEYPEIYEQSFFQATGFSIEHWKYLNPLERRELVQTWREQQYYRGELLNPYDFFFDLHKIGDEGWEEDDTPIIIEFHKYVNELATSPWSTQSIPRKWKYLSWWGGYIYAWWYFTGNVTYASVFGFAGPFCIWLFLSKLSRNFQLFLLEVFRFSLFFTAVFYLYTYYFSLFCLSACLIPFYYLLYFVATYFYRIQVGHAIRLIFLYIPNRFSSIRFNRVGSFRVFIFFVRVRRFFIKIKNFVQHPKITRLGSRVLFIFLGGLYVFVFAFFYLYMFFYFFNYLYSVYPGDFSSFFWNIYGYFLPTFYWRSTYLGGILGRLKIRRKLRKKRMRRPNKAAYSIWLHYWYRFGNRLWRKEELSDQEGGNVPLRERGFDWGRYYHPIIYHWRIGRLRSIGYSMKGRYVRRVEIPFTTRQTGRKKRRKRNRRGVQRWKTVLIRYKIRPNSVFFLSHFRIHLIYCSLLFALGLIYVRIFARMEYYFPSRFLPWSVGLFRPRPQKRITKYTIWRHRLTETDIHMKIVLWVTLIIVVPHFMLMLYVFFWCF